MSDRRDEVRRQLDQFVPGERVLGGRSQVERTFPVVTKISRVVVHRAEGLTSELGTWTFSGARAAEEADDRLRLISQTAPSTGGYDKVDVTVTLDQPFGPEDGRGFEFRSRHDVKKGDIDGTVFDHLLMALQAEAAVALSPAEGEKLRAVRLALLAGSGRGLPRVGREGVRGLVSSQAMKMLDQAVTDERDAVPFYQELARELDKAGFPDAAFEVKAIAADQARHGRTLERIRSKVRVRD